MAVVVSAEFMSSRSNASESDVPEPDVPESSVSAADVQGASVSDSDESVTDVSENANVLLASCRTDDQKKSVTNPHSATPIKSADQSEDFSQNNLSSCTTYASMVRHPLFGSLTCL